MLLDVYFVPVSCRRAARIMREWVGRDWPRTKAMVFRTPAAKGISGEVRKAEPFGAGWDAACGLRVRFTLTLHRCFLLNCHFTTNTWHPHPSHHPPPIALSCPGRQHWLHSEDVYWRFLGCRIEPLLLQQRVGWWEGGGIMGYKPLFCRFPFI